jgi:large subunit ribosomal protein L24
MFIKKGDNVIVRSGSDKGKIGKVLSVIRKDGKIIVEGVNVKKRHQRQRKANQKGQMIDKTMPFSVSKVMILDPGTNKGTRVGFKDVGGKSVRVSIKTGKEI